MSDKEEIKNSLISQLKKESAKECLKFSNYEEEEIPDFSDYFSNRRKYANVVRGQVLGIILEEKNKTTNINMIVKEVIRFAKVFDAEQIFLSNIKLTNNEMDTTKLPILHYPDKLNFTFMYILKYNPTPDYEMSQPETKRLNLKPEQMEPEPERIMPKYMETMFDKNQ